MGDELGKRRQAWQQMALEGSPMINVQCYVDARKMAALIHYAGSLGALESNSWSDFGRQVVDIVFNDLLSKGKLIDVPKAEDALKILEHYGFSTRQIKSGRAPRFMASMRGDTLQEDFGHRNLFSAPAEVDPILSKAMDDFYRQVDQKGGENDVATVSAEVLQGIKPISEEDNDGADEND